MASNISLEENSDDDEIFITQTPKEVNSESENELDNAISDLDMDLESLLGSSKDSGVSSIGVGDGVVVDGEAKNDGGLKENEVEIEKSPDGYQPEIEDISDEEWDIDVEGFHSTAPVHISTQAEEPIAAVKSSKGMMGVLKSVRPDVKAVSSDMLKPSRFREELTEAELEDLRKMKFAKNSDKKTNWACKAYNEWRDTKIAKMGAEFVSGDILLTDIRKPNMLQAQPLCNAMCRFITEVKKVDGSEYPPGSVKDLMMGLQRYFKVEKVPWRLLNPHDPIFVDLFNVVDNIMKERTSMGMGVVKSLSAISNPMEEKMWEDGLLGEAEPRQLLETVMYLIGVNLFLRGGDEHKKLRRPGFDPQIVVTRDSDNVKCLLFKEDAKSKTNQGGLRKKYHAPRTGQVYENPNRSRCLVSLYEKYVSLLPPPGKKKELYLQPRVKITPNCWYFDRCLGINSITPIVKRLCTAAGFENGVFRNQSLRATGLTRLFGANTDQQTIKDFSGHRSSAVDIYKKMSDKLRRQASAVVQGRSENINEVSIEKQTSSVGPIESKNVDCDQLEGDVFEANPMKIRTPLKRKSEVDEALGIDPQKICDMISKMSGQRKYKKIKVSLEFTDSD